MCTTVPCSRAETALGIKRSNVARARVGFMGECYGYSIWAGENSVCGRDTGHTSRIDILERMICALMPGAHLSIVALRRWFPPHDPLAAKIARCCILREDLKIEMEAILADEAESGDNPDGFRRLYYYRRFFASQMELSNAIQTLLGNPHFSELLHRQPDPLQLKFKKMAEIIGRAHRVLKDVRNDICGHVKASAVQEALEGMSLDSFGFLDIGPTTRLTRYEFAGELVAAMMLKEVSDQERKGLISAKYKLIADILPIFSLIDYCLAMYADDRGLMSFWPLE